MNKKGEAIVWGTIAVIIVVAAIIITALGVDTVDANHLGVQVKLGKILGTQEPGMQWTGMLTHVEQYDMRIRKAKVDMLDAQSSATDSGGQMVFGSISVNYRLKPNKDVVQRLYANVGSDNVLEDKLNLKPIIKEGYKQATVEYEAIDILQNRQEVKEKAKENIKKNFPQDYFEIVDIVVEDIDFSEEFKNAIEEKKIATQNKLKEEEQVQVVIFQQQQKIEEYKAQAEQLRLQKQEVTALLNQQKLIEQWDGHLPPYLVIMEGDGAGNGMFLQLAKGDIEATVSEYMAQQKLEDAAKWEAERAEEGGSE